jgi:hypothetical protein
MALNSTSLTHSTPSSSSRMLTHSNFHHNQIQSGSKVSSHVAAFNITAAYQAESTPRSNHSTITSPPLPLSRGSSKASSTRSTPPKLLVSGVSNHHDRSQSSFSFSSSSASSSQKLTFWDTLWVFKTWDFWRLCYGNMISIGAGLFVITSVFQLWSAFELTWFSQMPPDAANYLSNTDAALIFQANNAVEAEIQVQHWLQNVALLFSFCTALGNIFAPLLAEKLQVHFQIPRTRLIAVAVCILACDFVFIALASSGYVLSQLFMPVAVSGSAAHSTPAQDAVAYIQNLEESRMAFMIVLGAVGLFLGCFFVLIPQSVSDKYGTQNFGRYLSYINLGSAFLILFIPFIRSAAYDWFHNYLSSYWFIVLCLLTAAFSLYQMEIDTPPNQPEPVDQISDAI